MHATIFNFLIRSRILKPVFNIISVQNTVKKEAKAKRPAMDPFEEFNWCIRILRFAVKFVQRDIFENKQSSSNIKHHLFLLSYGIYLPAGLYTLKYYDLPTVLAAVPIVAGMWQV